MTTIRPQHGFTLLEVMVGLGILAIGLTAALRAGLATADAVETTRLHVAGRWIAENRFALLRATREWPEPGETTGEAAMANLRFRTVMRVTATPYPQSRRIEFSVAPVDAPATVQRYVTYAVQP